MSCWEKRAHTIKFRLQHLLWKISITKVEILYKFYQKINRTQNGTFSCLNLTLKVSNFLACVCPFVQNARTQQNTHKKFIKYTRQ